MDVTVLRVFTDAEGRFGNPLGVVDAASAPPAARQRIAAELGYSETVFVDIPATGCTTARAQIFTPTTELPFAGHPTVGAAWWLAEQSVPIRALEVPAGLVHIQRNGSLTAVVARPEWAPAFDVRELASESELAAVTPTDYPADREHYLWTWTDRDNGEVRARMFAANLGVAEDEATGAAAARLTAQLGRDLLINQGQGSQIVTAVIPDGWITISGRVVNDGVRHLSLDSPA